MKSGRGGMNIEEERKNEDLEVPKGSQATFSECCGSRGGYGAKAREIGLISN